MKTLALDTSTRRGSCALGEDARVVAEVVWDLPPRGHTEALVPTIEWMLKLVGWTHDDLDRVIVARGPGSFTGVRVAISVGQGIASARGIPALGASSLEALAFNAPFADGHIVVLLDAKKKEIYGAVFKWEDDAVVRVGLDTVEAPKTFLERLPDGPITLIGDGAAAYPDLVPARARVLPGMPHAGHLLRATLEDSLKPNYLRRPEAEIKSSG